MNKYILQLGLIIFSCVTSYSQTALIASVDTEVTKPLEHGVQELYDSLSRLGWDVEAVSGFNPSTNHAADLQFILATSNEKLDRYMQDFSIPSYEVSSKSGSYSYIVDPNHTKKRIFVVGSDWSGMMYGLFDLSERVSVQNPSSSNSFTISNENFEPALSKRGIAAYLHTQALSDQFSWYHDDSYWDGFIKQMANNRFNYLELRGAFDAVNAEYMNVYPYLIPGNTYTANQISNTLKENNLLQLSEITNQAAEYGIEVTLVNYKSSLNNPSSMQEIEDQENAQFTRNAIQVIVQNCPNLTGLGFRTGESGKNVSYYRSVILPALTAANTQPVLTVHPWLSDEFQIRTMMNSYTHDAYVVFKMNGDHLVHPYPVTGYRMSEWHSYSYESYFSLPRSYKTIFQVNTRGTNRVFPWMDIEFVKNTVKACKRFNADGLIVEIPSAQTPPYQLFQHSIERESTSKQWHHQRDWYWYKVWGQYLYDPDQSDEIVVDSFTMRFGEMTGRNVFSALEKASAVIPAMAAVYYPAPDVRSYSPEFEPPLSIFDWLDAQPLDLLSTRSVQEEISSRISRSVDAKKSPLQILLDAEKAAQEAVQLSQDAGDTLQRMIMQNSLANGKSVWREWQYFDGNINALAALCQYLRVSLECALQFGIFQKTGDVPSLLIASETTKHIMQPWLRFQKHMKTLYSPIHDAVRTKNPYFHWANLEPNVVEDQQRMSNEYLGWQQSDSWQQYLGHNRVFTARANEPFIVTCSIPSSLQVQRLTLRYKNSHGQTGNIPVTPSTVEGVFAVEVSAEMMTEGAFEYFIVGDVGGMSYKVPPENQGSFYTLSVTNDKEPPSILDTSHQLSVSKDRVTVLGNFFDESGIISAKLFWKALPSDAVWNEMNMSLSGSDFLGQFPITADGAMYAIEVIDGVGNGIRIPSVEQGMPYTVIPAYGSDQMIDSTTTETGIENQ